MKRKTPFLLLAIALAFALSLPLVACTRGDEGTQSYSVEETQSYSVKYVKFISDGNTYDIAPAQENSAVVIPAEPKKNGYAFDGWYFDENVWQNPVGNSLTVTTDTTVYAKWSPISYSISYNFDGGELPEGVTNPTSYTIESNDITLASPVRKGYAFDGWELGNNRIQTITKGNVGDLSFTAKWVKDGYTVTYENTKGTVNTNPLAYVISDSDIPLVNLSKDGYKFEGWYVGDSKITEIAANTAGDLTITAKWTPISYPITYNFDNGALAEGVTNPTSYTIESDDITLASPVRSGYAFDGWQSGDNIIRTIKKGSVGALSLTAKWIEAGYGITYDNTMDAKNENPLAYAISDKAIVLKDLSKDGYKFEGWFDGTNKITEIAANTTGNLTFTAKWTLETYTITYKGPNDEDLETEGYGLPESFTVESEDQELYGRHVTGYRFEKWMDDKGRTITFIPAGSFGNVVLYGIYKPDTMFNIYYIDDDFGKTNDANPTTYEIGDEITDLQPLEKLDYEFKGWSTGLEIVTSLDTSYGGNIFLYAVWEQKPEFKGLDYVLDEQKNVCILLDVEDKTVTKLEISGVFTAIKPGVLAGLENLEKLSVPFLGFESETMQSANLAYLFGYESNAAAGGAIPSSLTKVTVKGGAIGDYAFANLGNVKEIVLSPDITEIGFYAFYKCSQLVELTMPAFRLDSDALVNALKAKGATFISGYQSMAMYYGIVNSMDSDLKDANAPLINLHINGAGDVSTDWNAQGMFYYCKGIGTVTIDNLKVIHTSMFDHCEKLTQVTIGNTVEEIESYAFQYCASLTEIVIPDTVTKLGISYTNADGIWHAGQLSGAVFRACTALSKAVIGNGVEIIPRGTFESSPLKELTIGENVHYIDFWAFRKFSEDEIAITNKSKYKEWVVSGPIEASVMDSLMASDNAPEKIYYGLRSFNSDYTYITGGTTYQYFLSSSSTGYPQNGTVEQIARWKLVFYSPTDPYAEGGAASKDNADIEYWYHDDGMEWYLEKYCVTPKMWEKPQE